VLKLALPGQAVRAEADALAGFAGRGAARLLAADPAQGALLLERLRPGTPLAALAARDDDAATRAAGGVIAALRRPAPPGALLAEAAGWVRLLDRARAAAWPLPRPMLDRAAGLFRDLGDSAPPVPALLHGDLHHGNLLADGVRGGWRAVDPRGLRGDPAFEAAALLRNPPGSALLARAPRRIAILADGANAWRAVDPRGLLGDPAFEAAAALRNPPGSALVARAPRRIAILAETAGLDPARVAGWGYAAAVLAAGWAIEDGEDAAPWTAAAEAIAPSLSADAA
jgi:streptomycin 6-kinase